MHINVFLILKSTFKIADELDGSALSYTLTYADNNSDIVCGSAIIPASSCNSGICRHVFDVDSSSPLSICPTSSSDVYNVSVFASNFLGNGDTSSIATTISECTHMITWGTRVIMVILDNNIIIHNHTQYY